MEIAFPFEFNVSGTPVSLQAKRRASLVDWKNQVKQASFQSLPEGHFSSDAAISVTLFYFPDAPMQGDIDNIVKPILDALCRHIYMDDRQVERVWVQKFELARCFSSEVRRQLWRVRSTATKPVLYVRLSDNPIEGLV